MKLTILSTVAVAVFALFGATSAEAGPRFGGPGFGRGPVKGHHSAPPPRYVTPAPPHKHYYAPKVYKVRTVEVGRRKERRTTRDRYGRPYTHYVTVVTYRDHFSDGTYRTWTEVR